LSILFHHYTFAGLALAGTYAAAIAIVWLVYRSRASAAIGRFRGMSPPFLSVIGVIFALNLAFLANDTWNAHDRALAAIHQEAGALRALKVEATALRPAVGAPIAEGVELYARLVMTEEWAMLARRGSSEAAERALDRLLMAIAAVGDGGTDGLKLSMLQAVQSIYATRGTRIGLSQTHVNPLKWLGVAFLGLLTLVAIVMVHADLPRAGVLTVMIFATAAAPTAAIVLIQGNPYQPPNSVSAAPLNDLLRGDLAGGGKSSGESHSSGP
jgi:hypothetical protein